MAQTGVAFLFDSALRQSHQRPLIVAAPPRRIKDTSEFSRILRQTNRGSAAFDYGIVTHVFPKIERPSVKLLSGAILLVGAEQEDCSTEKSHCFLFHFLKNSG